jgi:hypothetical protein
MMHPYHLHSLGKLYHEEALKEARVRNLGHRSKAHTRPRSEERRPWLSKLASAITGSS